MRGILPGIALSAACLVLMAQAPALISPAARMAASQQRSIGNGVLKAVIFPPGENAFYGGTRFDHSGVVGSLTLGAQEYYGPWFAALDPAGRDVAFGAEGVVVSSNSGTLGPAEEYTPIFYDEAAPGGRFLQIGVGALVRPDDKPFDRFHRYEIADAGRWRITSTANSVTMEQTVRLGGQGYVYEKTITLTPGQPQMVIAHRLRNTGARPIVSSMYNHNFLTLDPGNADMAVTLPFPAVTARPSPRLTLSGNTVRWPNALVERENAQALLHDESMPPQTFEFKVRHEKTGAGYRVTSETPASRVNLWSIRTVMALEPYTAINVAPGAEQSWRYVYSFTPPSGR
jgi:hypothetical protein